MACKLVKQLITEGASALSGLLKKGRFLQHSPLGFRQDAVGSDNLPGNHGLFCAKNGMFPPKSPQQNHVSVIHAICHAGYQKIPGSSLSTRPVGDAGRFPISIINLHAVWGFIKFGNARSPQNLWVDLQILTTVVRSIRHGFHS